MQPHGVGATTRKRVLDMTKLEDKNTREYRLYHNITTPEQEMQRLEAIVRNLKRERNELRKELNEARAAKENTNG
jgi:seryl-tRNA synthetase